MVDWSGVALTLRKRNSRAGGSGGGGTGESRIESSGGSPVSGSRRGQLACRPAKKVGPGADCGTALHRLGIGAAGSAFLSLLTAC